jgi:hypothetical protein
MNAWATVDTVAVFKGLPDVDQQCLICQSTLRLGTGFPSVITAAMDFEYATHAA